MSLVEGSDDEVDALELGSVANARDGHVALSTEDVTIIDPSLSKDAEKEITEEEDNAVDLEDGNDDWHRASIIEQEVIDTTSTKNLRRNVIADLYVNLNGEDWLETWPIELLYKPYSYSKKDMERRDSKNKISYRDRRLNAFRDRTKSEKKEIPDAPPGQGDKPVEFSNIRNWYGLTVSPTLYSFTTPIGHIMKIDLMDNRLYGDLPESIGELMYLKQLFLMSDTNPQRLMEKYDDESFDLFGSDDDDDNDNNNNNNNNNNNDDDNNNNNDTSNDNDENENVELVDINKPFLVPNESIDPRLISHGDDELEDSIKASKTTDTTEVLNAKEDSQPPFARSVRKYKYIRRARRVLKKTHGISMGTIISALRDPREAIKEFKQLNLDRNRVTGNLPQLLPPACEVVELSGNEIGGQIPETIRDMKRLKILNLYINSLSGSIPDSLGQCIKLMTLNLHSNDLSGELPMELANCKRLKYINLSVNRLTGTIPEEWATMRDLLELKLSHNHLTGEIPSFLGHMRFLSKLYLSYNQFNGEIPESIGISASIKKLKLDNNNLTGGIPSAMKETAKRDEYDSIDLKCNDLDFQVKQRQALKEIYKDNGGEEGMWRRENNKGITWDTTQRDFLKIQTLSHIQINNLDQIVVLNLRNCNLHYQLSAGFFELKHLRILNCGFNKELKGNLPPLIGRLTSLRELRMRKCSIHGNIPVELGQLRKLKYLYLNGNSFRGGLPPELFVNPETGETNFPRLQILNLADNDLSGPLPREMGRLPALNIMNLQNNRFEGAFPDSFQHLKGSVNVMIDGNDKFYDVTTPWIAKVGKFVPQKIESIIQRLMLCGACMMAYLDLLTDIYVTYILWTEKKYFFFTLQILFSNAPGFFLALMESDPWMIMANLLQLNFAIETYKSLRGHEETQEFLLLKLFSAVVEALPSSVLQLIVVLTDKASMASFSQAFVVFSLTISIMSMAWVFHKLYIPRKEIKHQISTTIRILGHFAELVLRGLTFAAYFLTVGVWFFAGLFAAFILRFFITHGHIMENENQAWEDEYGHHHRQDIVVQDGLTAYKDDSSPNRLNLTKIMSNAVITLATICSVDSKNFVCVNKQMIPPHKAGIKVFLLWLLSTVEWIFVSILLFHGPLTDTYISTDISAEAVYANRKTNVIIVGYIMLFIFTLLTFDRHTGMKPINAFFAWPEHELLKLANAMKEEISATYEEVKAKLRPYTTYFTCCRNRQLDMKLRASTLRHLSKDDSDSDEETRSGSSRITSTIAGDSVVDQTESDDELRRRRRTVRG